jgi:lysosomal acid lipase/cholesteryl ester hydrolase
LSYIGFSQGTAQAFASLSIHPTLNDKVDVFIALAPAMAPPGLASGLVNSLAKASPYFLFLVFGRKAILGSATMWQTILYPPIFVRFVDMGVTFLFGWHNRNMDSQQKLAAYPHLYSFTSTKSVVHWFQIISSGKLQMYDDEIQGPFSISDTSKYYKVAKFPTRNIRTPIVLVYGGSDSLVDIRVMLKELPRHAEVKEVPHYEHLDFLWARDVHKQVFPHVFKALDRHARGTVSREPIIYSNLPYPAHSHTSLSQANHPKDDSTPPPSDDFSSVYKHSQSTSNSKCLAAQLSRIPIPIGSSPPGSGAATPTPGNGTRPEGWWSSDEVAVTETDNGISTPLTGKLQISRTRGSGVALAGMGQSESIGHHGFKAPPLTRKTSGSSNEGSAREPCPRFVNGHSSSRTSSPGSNSTKKENNTNPGEGKKTKRERHTKIGLVTTT